MTWIKMKIRMRELRVVCYIQVILSEIAVLWAGREICVAISVQDFSNPAID
jgi:hypothetical protein